MTNKDLPTVREQRQRLYAVEEQDALSPFVLVDEDNQVVPVTDTPREQRTFLFEIDEQDAPSKFRLLDRTAYNELPIFNPEDAIKMKEVHQ